MSTTAPLPFVEQTQLSLSHRVKTAKGSMAVSSLRPGDFVRWFKRDTFCVLINSQKHQRCVIRWDSGTEESATYQNIAWDPLHKFIGQGTRRRWHAFLPRWLQKRVCPFSQPSA